MYSVMVVSMGFWAALAIWVWNRLSSSSTLSTEGSGECISAESSPKMRYRSGRKEVISLRWMMIFSVPMSITERSSTNSCQLFFCRMMLYSIGSSIFWL